VRFLFATGAYNAHAQNLALALHEAGALGAYHAGCVDHYRRRWVRHAREVVGTMVPRVDRVLRRRRMDVVPDALVHGHWAWELPRSLGGYLGVSARMQDRLWECGEQALDRTAARLLERTEFDAFLGIEHGALCSIEAARRLGKKSVVAFLSPHHAVRERWVDAEYARFPELRPAGAPGPGALTRTRDTRRDQEAARADAVHANSRFTARSLVAAGVPEAKIVEVPLGSPRTIAETALPSALGRPLVFICAGSVSVPKGAHYLLDAWKRLGVRAGAELHLYGRVLLPTRCFDGGGADIVVHGSVPQSELFAAFQRAAVLVFPTLCDGFGAVVSEAMAHGLPVITTSNAGAAELVDEGRNGFVVPPADAAALAERMAWCLSHPVDVLAMRREALATARRWSWADFRHAFRVGLFHQLAASAA
jgi:glycosyltransferase involved in cell wall biosynthesis